MRKAKLYVSKELLATALFAGQLEVLDVAPAGASYVEMTVEGAPIPQTPDAGEIPRAQCIISLTAPFPPPGFTIKLLPDD
jgi:hypothetical protein